MLEIRVATPSDQPAIESLSLSIWAHNEVMAAPGLHGLKPTVAMSDGTIVAVGSCVPSRRSPERATVHIDVDANHRRHGIGSEVFKHLVRRTGATMLIARALRSQSGAILFVTSLGFEVAEEATEGWIDARAAASWVDATLAHVGLNASVLGDRHLDDAARLLAAHMVATHPWLPDLSFTPAEMRARFVGNALAVVGTTVEGEVVAAASLQQPSFGPVDGRAFLTWTAAFGAESAALTRVVVARALAEARDRGLEVRVECNNHNADFLGCLQSIPGAELEQDLTVWTKPLPRES